MATQYRKFKLSPGQQAPEGNTGHGLKDGYIVWIGEEGTFPEAILSYVMTDDEILEYNTPPTDKLQSLANLLIPASNREITSADFNLLFTFEERCSVYELAKTDTGAKVIIDDLSKLYKVNKDSAGVLRSLNYLKDKGCFTAERIAEILA